MFVYDGKEKLKKKSDLGFIVCMLMGLQYHLW